MFRKLSATLVIAVLVGCATSSKKLSELSVGMTKDDVLRVLGSPESTRANQGVEFLVYTLTERIAKPGEAPLPFPVQGKYFVRLVGGRVDSYGHLGDFDSTKPFQTKHEIDVNVQQR